MALQIQDITVWMLALFVFNYLVIYRKSRFLGAIGYMLFGIMMYGIRTEFAYTETMYAYIALFVFLGGMIVMVYELVASWHRTRMS